MRALALTLPLAACALPVGPDSIGPLAAVEGYTGAIMADHALVVSRTAQPFGYDEGAEAKRAANALCRGAVASGPEDNFREGQWIFPRGCA
ncbi:hypothetical protein C8J27_101724 [Rhodobacter aestuarii]|uniref:Uncharacterized protein n=1 Tax=Rhodobacter aestuarii TaxID=453582 RepID=A0A1N7P5P1_9RHOB|nr:MULTISPECIES: hypothetical protein [Rhodobacter]PTV97607.1 hypothetical protein C8J27_101724 [Rhodobacter aestuarii]SIT05923.1 hypothetical protein SAMN05421580_10984 [Rhodobacter aestuarii]SOC04913.1 hypothetical protein SAMN05877809_103339 [Rhodobacter sp. JA431]